MNIRDFFEFEPVGARLADLETPVPVIDIDVADRNLKRWQARCDQLGIGNRPHIKTHKLVGMAKYQEALGAKGITDQLITFNIVGTPKVRHLAALAKRTDISVVADNPTVVAAIGEAGTMAGRKISVLVECDTGAHRNGVQSPEAAAELARAIESTAGATYGGLMTYARPGTRREAEAFLTEARDLAAKSGLETRTISSGGSPDMWSDEGLSICTEYRVGTYIYFDRSLVARGTCAWEDCALTVLATVVSTPTGDRALIDAGSKALTSDLLGLKGYGVIHDLSDAQVYDLNEEHGYLDTSGLATKPKVGDLLRVVPNHVCPVVNLFDKVVFISGDEVLGAVKVDARGAVQ